MKYARAMQGKRAERSCAIPITNDAGEPGELVSVVVPLTSAEESEALVFARAYAVARGVADPKAGDPLYDLGYEAGVVAAALRDPDGGEPGRREPTFSGGANEVLAELSRETLLYLFTVVEDWCEECSPLLREMSDAAMFGVTRQLADKEGDKAARFFDRLGPGMRRRYALFSAPLLWTALEHSSLFGGTPASNGVTTQSSSSPSP